MKTNNYEIADIAEKFFGTPYVWGGNDIETGIDCSAFVSECLRSVGKLDSKDYNAQMLWDRWYYKTHAEDDGQVKIIYNGAEDFGKASVHTMKRNDILLYGDSTDNITHVAIYLGQGMIIEAGGEGRVQTTKGYVRYRSLNHRKDLIAVVRFR